MENENSYYARRVLVGIRRSLVTLKIGDSFPARRLMPYLELPLLNIEAGCEKLVEEGILEKITQKESNETVYRIIE